MNCPAKELPSEVDLPDWVPEKEWNEFLSFRFLDPRSTDVGTRRKVLFALDQLAHLRRKGNSPTAVLRQAIDRCQRGLEPLRESITVREFTYRSARAALKSAYAIEANNYLGVRGLCAESGGGGLKPIDVVTQAALTLNVVRHALKGQLTRAWALEVLHTVPANHDLAYRKKCMCVYLGDCLWAERKQLAAGVSMSLEFIIDEVRDWSGLEKRVPDEWWEAHLCVTDKTLRRARYGRGDRPGIATRLDQLYSEAERNAGDALRQAGLIQ